MPALGHKHFVLLRGKTVVNQDANSLVTFASDNSARRLKHLVHTGIGIGVGVAVFSGVVKILLDDIKLRGDGGQANANDYSADKPLTP